MVCCVSVCVCLCVVCVCVCVCVQKRARYCPHAHTRTHMHARACIHTHTDKQTRRHADTHADRHTRFLPPPTHSWTHKHTDTQIHRHRGVGFVVFFPFFPKNFLFFSAHLPQTGEIALLFKKVAICLCLPLLTLEGHCVFAHKVICAQKRKRKTI